ncbi:YkyA family protein [Priestia aryabhattai]|uniref:YkyA family protein n=1 Tax=Priestia aryabhattai TaxID=412384 RepID=UPI003CB316FE
MKCVGRYIVIGIAAMSLAGCAEGSSPELEVYNGLEKVVAQEKQFADQQKPLADLEQQENAIYDQIIELGIKDKKKIKNKAQKAQQLLDERENKLQKEEKSISASQKQFEATEPKIQKLEDGKAKKEALELSSLMKKRYKAYQSLHDAYLHSIELDRQLYTLFEKDNVKLENLETQIASINVTYKEVEKKKETFNTLTADYNKAKEDFYNKTKLKVKNSEDK